MYRGKIRKIHFVGIGGSGMSGIAEVLLNMGYRVSGSDLRGNDASRRLATLGASVMVGHKKGNVAGVDCVVYSSAVSPDNVELQEAEALQIPIIPRAEMLAELMRMKYGIAIAGTHGKTTTTSMTASILEVAGIDPTVVTGGKLNATGSNATLGKGDFLVAEADESDGSFLRLTPSIAVVTSIDREHMNHYSSMDDMKEAYINFMNKVPFYGCSIVCLDHPAIQSILPSISRRYVTYGLSAQAEVHAAGIEKKGTATGFDLMVGGKALARITIGIPGDYNVCNALAAAAVAIELGVSVKFIEKGLESFKGVERRFQVKGRVGNIMVVDDYGHHPVEIKAVLKAVKDGWNRRAVIVFQPHRYSRTEDLFSEFITSFNDADILIITDVYAAGEKPHKDFNSGKLFEAIKKHGHRAVEYIALKDEVPARLIEVAEAGDMVVTLGAGDVWQVGEEFVEALEEKHGTTSLRLVKEDEGSGS
ncbi:UDP-N-acetylmuramate--L-alanine ligase [hydrothermal vent metagenome]|uniref:UDP-N-acetylmuramate--L-alanine ligase n=1 Tax=hydrothermal vent metagenome TaxID=652676 RepID=A0A3B0V568_9ZZZZ